MLPRPLKRSVACRVAAIVVLAAGVAQAAPPTGRSTDEAASPANAVTPDAPLAPLCRKAGESFTPPTEAMLAASRRQALAAVSRLERRLDTAGPTGEAWGEYLDLGRLRAELARPGESVDLQVVRRAFARLSRRHEGLNLVWFADLRDAVKSYLYLAQAASDPEKARDQYEQLIEQLAARLEAFRQKPNAADAQSIAAAVDWLEAVGQAPECVAAIRRRLAEPNLRGRFSREVVAAGIAGPIEDTSPVTDVILGTTIYGDATTKGRVEVELVPFEHMAIVDAVFFGTTHSDNIGYNGPVRIYSQGLTRTGARKRLLFDGLKVRAMPTVSKAITDSEIEQICAVRGGRLVQRVAWKRAAQSKPQAEAIAAVHAEERLNRRIDARTAEFVEQANRRLREKVRQPLRRRRLYPQEIQFRTSADFVHLAATYARGSQLGAATAPPEAIASPDIAFQLHESMVNNAAATALAGRRLTEAQLKDMLEDLLGEMPERFDSETESEPWAIDFASMQPLTVTFDKNSWSVTLRAANYYRGETRYPGMSVSVQYQLVAGDDGPKAVLQGEPAIFPPGFTRENSRRLSAREQVIRDMLARRMEKLLQPEIVPGDLELSGEWGKLRPLRLVQWETESGWLVAAWKRAAPAKPKADKAKGD
jgi:hypothetical protein